MDKNILKHKNLLLFSIIVVGALLRISLLGQHRFHGDEALYAYWAMDMAEKSSLYVGYAFLLDKPPVFMLIAALFYSVMPVSEIFAELPNIIAGILSIYFIYKIASYYFNNIYAAFLATLIYSLAPVNILFSATAFTDPLMVFFGLAGLFFLLRGRYFAFGAVLGLALGTKQFAVFLLPLFLAVIIRDILVKKDVNIKQLVKRGAAGFIIIFWLFVISCG